MLLRTVPKVLRPGHRWLEEGNNRESLGHFLRIHGFDITEVYEVEFGAKTMTVFRYESDEDGRRFLRDGEVARKAPATVNYRGGMGPLKLV